MATAAELQDFFQFRLECMEVVFHARVVMQFCSQSVKVISSLAFSIVGRKTPQKI